MRVKRLALFRATIPTESKTMEPDSAVFHTSAAIYDLLYENKDSASEARWVMDSLQRHGLPDGATVLELGAGTGRHARHLADLGCEVTGVDPSTEMLAMAIRHPRVSLRNGDGRDIRLDREFDAVVALFHVMSYQKTVADAQSFFTTAAAHTKSGGLFAFDIWYSPAVHHLTPTRRQVTKESDALSVSRTAVPTEDIQNSRVDVEYQYSVVEKNVGREYSFSEIHPMRHFSFTEIALLASEAGFEILETQEFLTGSTPSRQTWGVWFVLGRT